MAKGDFTPAGYVPLVKHEDGVPTSGRFNYISVGGMLPYLSGHTNPDIAFEVNCCSRYMFCLKHLNEDALNKIGRYLKLTQDCGLILNISWELFKINIHPDADFSGMYGHEKPDDTIFVKSFTSYVITF